MNQRVLTLPVVTSAVVLVAAVSLVQLPFVMMDCAPGAPQLGHVVDSDGSVVVADAVATVSIATDAEEVVYDEHDAWIIASLDQEPEEADVDIGALDEVRWVSGVGLVRVL